MYVLIVRNWDSRVEFREAVRGTAQDLWEFLHTEARVAAAGRDARNRQDSEMVLWQLDRSAHRVTPGDTFQLSTGLAVDTYRVCMQPTSGQRITPADMFEFWQVVAAATAREVLGGGVADHTFAAFWADRFAHETRRVFAGNVRDAWHEWSTNLRARHAADLLAAHTSQLTFAAAALEREGIDFAVRAGVALRQCVAGVQPRRWTVTEVAEIATREWISPDVLMEAFGFHRTEAAT